MVRTFLMLTILLLPAVTAGAQAQTDSIPATLYQTVNVRSGPDTRYEIVGQVTEGDTVQVVGREGEASRWLHVVLPDGTVGWIPSFYLVFESDPGGLPLIDSSLENVGESAEVTIQAYGQVNVRSGPGIAYDIIGQLDVDDSATALARSSEQNDWLYIENDALSGWVAYFTVQVQGDPSVLAVRVPDAGSAGLVSPTVLIETRFNTLLHSEATLESASVGQVDFNSRVTPLAKSADSEWLYVAHEDVTGWATADLFTISREALDALPFYSPDVDYLATPAAPDAEATETPLLIATEEAAEG
jgi:uncharacterized protein YgiM (DUF1202 family)